VKARLRREAARFEAALDALCTAGAWLALPVSMLLFAQWPLRDVAGGHPLLVNDIAQTAFALYVAIAVRYTTRYGGHLRADLLARRYGASWRRRIEAVGAALVLLPWSSLLLWLAVPGIWQSLRQLEKFPESYNPGYFVIKLALSLLLLLVALQALLDAWRRPHA
jgi:TRAP-type mannitol/chloroaromatic compound transport system permease small subunit